MRRTATRPTVLARLVLTGAALTAGVVGTATALHPVLAHTVVQHSSSGAGSVHPSAGSSWLLASGIALPR